MCFTLKSQQDTLSAYVLVSGKTASSLVEDVNLPEKKSCLISVLLLLWEHTSTLITAAMFSITYLYTELLGHGT